MVEITQIAFIWVALLFLDACTIAFFFADVGRKEYWANVVSAGFSYFITTGLAMMLTSGAMTLAGAGTAAANVDAWAANLLSWLSYFMLAMTGFALLKNTVLAPERGERKNK